MRFYNKNKYVILIVITLIQILLMVYWGTRKENLYWDEYFTMERAHYAADNTPIDHHIDTDKDYEFNKWQPLSLVNDTLIVTQENTSFNDSFLRNLQKMFKAKSYSVMLNMCTYLISPGIKSIWPSIILNIIFFVLNQVLLYILALRLTHNSLVSLLTTVFYGFSSMCFSMTVFVRFYMLATFLVTAFTLCHMLYWELDVNCHVKKLVYLGLACVALLCGYNNAEFVMFYGGLFMIVYAIALLIRKGIKSFLLYAVPVFGGGFVYLYAKTDYLRFLYDFDTAFDMADGALKWCLECIVDFRPYMLPGRIKEMTLIMGRYMFGSVIVMGVIVIVVLVMALLKNFDLKDGIELKDSFLVLTAAVFVFFAFFTMFRLYDQVRYISYAFPEVALILVVLMYGAFKSKKKSLALVILVIAAEILSVNLKAKVDMLYTGDRAAIAKINEFNADSVFLYARTPTFISYQAAYLADDSAEFFAYDGESIESVEENLRDDMLLVTYKNTDWHDVQELLINRDYNIDFIADTYSITAYHVTKKY